MRKKSYRQRSNLRRHAQNRSHSKATNAALFATVLLLIITAGFLKLADPMLVKGAVTALEFEPAFPGWQVTNGNQITVGSDGKITLRNHSTNTTVALKRNIRIPKGTGTLRLSANASASGITTGKDPWMGGRIYLAQLDKNSNPIWQLPHELFQLNGDVSNTQFKDDFEILGEVTELRIAVLIFESVGTLNVSDLQLNYIVPSTIHRLLTLVLFSVWCLLFGVVGAILVKNLKGMQLKLASAFLVFLICIGVFAPQHFNESLIGQISRTTSIDSTAIELFAHLIAFSTLTFFFRLGFSNGKTIVHLIAWLLIAAATEVLQELGGRQMEWQDWSADIAGILLGLFVAPIFRGRFRKFY